MVLDANGQGQCRKVHVFDAWEALPYDGDVKSDGAKFLSVTEAEVHQNFKKYDVLDDNVVFHKGLFMDTLPRFKKEIGDNQISVLRLDGNFYDSYQDSFYYLYDRVPVGGYVIFDDWSPDVVREAWAD